MSQTHSNKTKNYEKLVETLNDKTEIAFSYADINNELEDDISKNDIREVAEGSHNLYILTESNRLVLTTEEYLEDLGKESFLDVEEAYRTIVEKIKDQEELEHNEVTSIQVDYLEEFGRNAKMNRISIINGAIKNHPSITQDIDEKKYIWNE